MEMNESMLPVGTEPQLAKRLCETYKKFDTTSPAFSVENVQGKEGLYKMVETSGNKVMRKEIMKAALRPYLDQMNEQRLNKSAINIASGFQPYDLRAPALHLVPWLSPIRESLPRIARTNPGAIAHWKSIIAGSSSYARGGLPAMGWVNEGQRAPQISLNTINSSATYATMGRENSVTFEAESSSMGFEDAIASAHFFTLESLMVIEEDALLGGNNSLALGTANKPVGSQTGSGSFTGTFYAACVGLTYEGYRNFVLANGFSSSGAPLVTTGLTQQQSLATPDGKTMTTNAGCGQASAISTTTAAPSSSVTATFTTTAKTGEIAWLWYIGTSNSTSALYLTALTTVPSYSFTAAPAATANQLLSTLTAADYSQNNGATGGGTNQVTGFDGILTQAFNNTSLNPQNAYVSQLAGAVLTTSGKGNVNEIDAMLLSLWNLYKVTVDVIYVNAQEMTNITSRVLNGSSAPLLRVTEPASGSDGFDLTGSGIISFYHNPYVPGGRKIPIIIHPTLPPGTMVGYAKTLPSYFKTNATPNVAEVLTRRDYYSQEWPLTTREYQHGVYTEEVLALYAPFCFGIITGIGNG